MPNKTKWMGGALFGVLLGFTGCGDDAGARDQFAGIRDCHDDEVVYVDICSRDTQTARCLGHVDGQGVPACIILISKDSGPAHPALCVDACEVGP